MLNKLTDSGTRRALGPFIKAYTLNDTGVPDMIEVMFLSQGILGSLGIWGLEP